MNSSDSSIRIRPYRPADRDEVIDLWHRSGVTRPWNDPGKDIERKSRIQPDLFLVAAIPGEVVGSVMAGYDGHRGWIYYLAVRPGYQRMGIGRKLVAAVETRLRALGCPKVNLQVRRDNLAATEFYRSAGFVEDEVVSYGKRLEVDLPPPAIDADQ